MVSLVMEASRPTVYAASDAIAPIYFNIDLRQVLPGSTNYWCRGTLFAVQCIALIYGADLVVDCEPAPPLPEEEYADAWALQYVLLWRRGKIEAMKAIMGATPTTPAVSAPSIFGRI
jgi:hypothetical protein